MDLKTDPFIKEAVAEAQKAFPLPVPVVKEIEQMLGSSLSSQELGSQAVTQIATKLIQSVE